MCFMPISNTEWRVHSKTYHKLKQEIEGVAVGVIENKRQQSLYQILAHCSVWRKPRQNHHVRIGHYVTLHNKIDNSEITVQVVGDFESNLFINKINFRSEFAQLLLDKTIGQTVTLITNSGHVWKWKVKSIQTI